MTNKAVLHSSGHIEDGRNEKRPATSPSEGQLAASIAHEINNPLGVLLNLLYLIEPEAILTEQGRQYLKLAREEVHRISEIAHAALHDSRHKPLATNLPNLLQRVLEFYQSRLESQRIQVRTRYCRNGEIAAYAGPLRQLLSNLLLNASDAMPRGGRLHARISVGREWSGLKRRGLRVTIADNGCGIPVHQITRIFDPFFTTKGDRGSGLGLPFVKEVVQKHDGVLRLRSSTARGRSGSIFTIFLPETQATTIPASRRMALVRDNDVHS